MQVDDGGLARGPPRRERLTTALTATVSSTEAKHRLCSALTDIQVRVAAPPRYLRWAWKKPTSVCQVSVVLSVVLVGLQWFDFTRVEDG